MIYAESRYERDVLAPVRGSDGVWRATIQPYLGFPNVEEYTSHRVAAGDTITSLADAAYGDPEFWWRIAEANPDVLGFPDELVPGMLLRVPVLAVE